MVVDLRDEGYRFAPCLHFIWFGVPTSSRAFAPVRTWAKALSSGWLGVCLWVDAACIAQAIKGREKGYREEPGTLVMEATGFPLIYSGFIEVDGGKRIFVVPIDANLDVLAEKSGMKTLKDAIDYERVHAPPFQLVQVASDILRIIVLRFCGGAYFDFDVDPSLVCRNLKFPEPVKIPLGHDGILCHAKPGTGFSENDIVFADPMNREALDRLTKILKEMSGYYADNPRRRHEWLVTALEEKFPLDWRPVFEKYKSGQGVTGATLYRLAFVVQQDVNRGSNTGYKSTLDDDVAEFCRNISMSVELATFRSFQTYVPDGNRDGWARLLPFFSPQTNTKSFYSWGDPGASTSLRLIDDVTAIQTRFRARRSVRFVEGVKRMKYHLRDLSVSAERRQALAESWLRDIHQDYGYMPSVEEIDSWLRMNWPD
ncbi:hypothetical protein HJC22_04185 [Corallococcus exiguus]|uniref:hypothetical protein n=1 Tax=Corallococcus exiguus TaxID=83462 RepID=UPI0014721FF4|nr:hypothetical protein [Corallococcus exiguus]NNC14932.1 hypothetical protein [Corallococcus exiguus]